MSVKLINPERLRIDLDNEINEYHEKVQNGTTSSQEKDLLLGKILNERNFLLDEIEFLKGKLANNFSLKVHDGESFNILLNEIDEFLYNDFYNLAKRLGYSGLGEVLNTLMKDFLSRYDGVFPDFSAKSLKKLLIKEITEISIDHKEELSVNQEEILELSDSGIRINFNHIERLEFINVDIETFKQYIGSINYCTLIRVPDDFPKLLLYTKCHHCSYFEFYKADASRLDNKKIEYAKEANKMVEHWNNNGN